MTMFRVHCKQSLDDSATGPADSQRSAAKIEPFESIKEQIKRNSIPDAEAIRRHIERIISHNEQIMDNSNQISIRAYNSSSTPGCTTGAPTQSAPIAQSGPKQPSKRWSTSVLCTKDGRVALEKSPEINFAPASGPSRSGESNGCASEPGRPYMRAIRRVSQYKRPLMSFNQHAQASGELISGPHCPQNISNPHPLAHSINLLSPANNTRPTSPLPPLVANSMPSCPLRQSACNGSLDIVHSSASIASDCAKPSQIFQNEPLQQQRQQQQQQTIESAIENLSLKRRDDAAGQGAQLVQFHALDRGLTADAMVSMLQANLIAESQNRHRLSGDHASYSCATSSDHNRQSSAVNNLPSLSIPNPLLNGYRHQHLLGAHQHPLENQVGGGLSRVVAIENELHQQRVLAQLMTMPHLHGNSASLAGLGDATSFHSENAELKTRALEAEFMNDYIAKLMLAQRERHGSERGLDHQPAELLDMTPNGKDGGANCQSVNPFQVSPTSPSRVYLSHGSEMQTQSLDSATPSYRCEACDIPFWTRDLLNYHSMTSCSARSGPRPTIPMAFTFNQQPPPKATASAHAAGPISVNPSLGAQFNCPRSINLGRGDEQKSSTLPIKKRKISEPNMKYF